MTTKHILIALAMFAALTMVSCKNNKKSQEPTQEEIQAQKVALADSVLAEIDAITNEYLLAVDNSAAFSNFKLTEEEKMVKPDYLLDPSVANTLVTKSQKVNALAMYLVDMQLRKAYDMPLDETKEAVSKLAADINHPFDEKVASDIEIPVSEKIRKEYEESKKNGDLAYFWQFQNAVVCEVSYLMAQNPELFLSKTTEEQWQAFRNRIKFKYAALSKLAQYDEEIAMIHQLNESNFPYSSREEMREVNKTKESAKQYRGANKDKIVEKRNALLK